jgi:RNA polymerase sigma-70 factor, ECF subfamily
MRAGSALPISSTPPQSSSVEAVRDLLPGGLDGVFDFVGLSEVTTQALKMLTVGGTLYLIGVSSKLGQFRGDSRFTTWAYKFVIFEVSAKLGRHSWRHPSVPLDAEDWDRLPAWFGFDPAQEAEWRDLLAALRRAVDTELTDRQRAIFVAIVLDDVPLDALALELASSRNALYKALFDAWRKLWAALVANGYLGYDIAGRS